jgi:2Fe-2S ferredoxin
MKNLLIEVTDRRGKVHLIESRSGSNLMELLKAQGLPVAATCGGAKSCATCHVYVHQGYDLFNSPDEDEADLLCESNHFRDRVSRLSCQISPGTLTGSLRIELAPQD